MRERGHGITHDIPPASRITARARERKMPTGKIPDRHLTGFLLVSEGGLEPPRPIKGTSTSS